MDLRATRLADGGRPVLVVFDGKVTAVEIPLAPALDSSPNAESVFRWW